MAITSDLIRGNTDMIILAQLLNKDSYGYVIMKLIQKKSCNKYKLKEPTLYSAIQRLESTGLIVFLLRKKAVGKTQKYISITRLGRLYYEQEKANWEEFKSMIDMLIY